MSWFHVVVADGVTYAVNCKIEVESNVMEVCQNVQVLVNL